jgi:hypothetical protein
MGGRVKARKEEYIKMLIAPALHVHAYYILRLNQ